MNFKIKLEMVSENDTFCMLWCVFYARFIGYTLSVKKTVTHPQMKTDPVQNNRKGYDENWLSCAFSSY